jgi:hypothetical protein
MARIFHNTCGDDYDTAHAYLKWDQVGNIAVVSGISGMTGNCIRMFAGGSNPVAARRNLPSNYSELIAGMRYRSPGLPVSNSKIFAAFWDTGNMQIALFTDSSGRITAWVGDNSDEPDVPHGTQIAATASGLIRPNTNCHIEYDIVFAHGSATGSLVIKVNSQIVASVASVVTANFSGTSNQFSIHSGSSDFWNGQYFDDIYVNSTADDGTHKNMGFDGDQQVLLFLPTGVGQFTQMAIGGSIPAATNWQSVNSAIPNDGVTLVSAGSVGLKDTYALGNLPANVAAITCIASSLDIETDASGLGAGAQIAPMLGNGSSTITGASVSLNTDWNDTSQYWGQNPITSSAWQITDFPALEVGLTRTS